MFETGFAAGGRRLLLGAAFLGAALLAGCAAKNDAGLLIPVAPAQNGTKTVSLLVAATRLRGEDPYSLSIGRSHIVNFQRVELSIPPNHQLGEIERPSKSGGNAAREFAALVNAPIGDAEFARLANSQAAKADGEVTLFVHGFNTTYEAAVLRLAQIVNDAGARGAAVVFSWPSRGRFLDYLTDRESATFSRDRLEFVLRLLGRQPGIRHINVLAHSMGAFLTMETLRQAKLRGDGEFGGKLNAVVLAAPDIDLDVFRTHLEVIGRRKRPTILLVSSDDQALSLSRALSGDVERVGVVKVDSPEAQAEIERLGLTVIDLTKIQAGDGSTHSKFAAAPDVIRHVGGLIEQRNVSGGTLAADAQGRLHANSNK